MYFDVCEGWLYRSGIINLRGNWVGNEREVDFILIKEEFFKSFNIF